MIKADNGEYTFKGETKELHREIVSMLLFYRHNLIKGGYPSQLAKEEITAIYDETMSYIEFLERRKQ